MKFEVTIKEIEIYEMEVEAEDKDAAIEQAWEMIDTEEGKAKYHNDSDGESSAVEID